MNETNQAVYWQHFGDAGENKIEATCRSCGRRIERGILSQTAVVLCGGCAMGLVEVAWSKASRNLFSADRG